MLDELVRPNLTALQAGHVYAALVRHAGARDDADDMAAFVHEFSRPNPTSEYRFIGGLGMGGKFRFPRMSVDCYPEDSTPARASMVTACNEALAQLRASFNADA